MCLRQAFIRPLVLVVNLPSPTPGRTMGSLRGTTETQMSSFNSLRPRQNGRHFADDIFRCIFVDEKFYILIKISLTFVRKGPTDNNPTLV